MATNDFLAQGGDGYTMLSGEREEGPSLDRVVMDAMESGVVNLADYADELPQNQIIPMLTADYQALLAETGEGLGDETNEETPLEEAPIIDVPGEESPVEVVPVETTPAESTDYNEESEKVAAGLTKTNKGTKVTDTDLTVKAKSKEIAVAATTTLPAAGFTTGGIGMAISAIIAGLGLVLPGRKRH